MPNSCCGEPNHDEATVRTFTLPDVLAGPSGAAAATAEEWRTTARPHQLQVLEKFVYGRQLPAVPVTVVATVERADVTLAGDVPAVRLQATLRLGVAADAPTTDVLLYLPKTTERVPVFLNLNFRGNHAEHADPGIRLSTAWMPDDKAAAIENHRATEASRGTSNAT